MIFNPTTIMQLAIYQMICSSRSLSYSKTITQIVQSFIEHHNDQGSTSTCMLTCPVLDTGKPIWLYRWRAHFRQFCKKVTSGCSQGNEEEKSLGIRVLISEADDELLVVANVACYNVLNTDFNLAGEGEARYTLATGLLISLSLRETCGERESSGCHSQGNFNIRLTQFHI